MRIALILCAGMLAAPSSAMAQDMDRYQMERTPNGYVRLDKRSGEMSICTDQGGQLVCKLAADDRQAYDRAIDRLQSSVDALTERVAKLEANPKSDLPTETEFEQTMDYMQRFFRSFMGVVKEFDRDLRGTPEELEQRT